MKAIINIGCPETALQFQKKSKNQSPCNRCPSRKAVKRRWQHQGSRPGAKICGIPTGHETRLMLTPNTIQSTLILLFSRCRSSYAAYINAGYSRSWPESATVSRPTHSYISFSLHSNHIQLPLFHKFHQFSLLLTKIILFQIAVTVLRILATMHWILQLFTRSISFEASSSSKRHLTIQFLAHKMQLRFHYRAKEHTKHVIHDEDKFRSYSMLRAGGIDYSYCT